MTVIYSSPIFGPIHSRRLGVSLGINLMPDDGKCCSFDCIYCECGFNCDFVPQHSRPTREQVRMALEAKLVEMKADGPAPDVLTFAGNGEPTLHPDFPCIIDDTIALRDRYFPQAKVSVLSNSSQIVRQEIFDALCRVDNNMCKLDTVSAEAILWNALQIAIYMVFGVIQMLGAYIFVKTEDRSRTVKKIDKLQKFKIYAQSSLA